ncbi:MAG: family 78 glycoside hydrolase catalytic domain [Clostridia bacterium]|nr:family 78 glycoside hydrolase catalytic domain [Clostridia bacterium]
MNQTAKFICNPLAKNEKKDHPWSAGRFYNSPERTITPGEGLSLFRRDFDLPKGCAKVTVAATALGVFDLYINGKPVGNEEMKPGWTDYTCRVFEFEYDVTALCVEESVLTAAVSNGWWSGRISFGTYGWREPAFAAEIAFFDKSGACIDRIVTDDSWETVIGGQILFADIWDGEYRDATMPDAHTFPEGYFWKKASLYEGSVPAIVPHVGEPLRVRPAFNHQPRSAVLYSEVKENGTDYGEIVPVFTRVGAGCEKTYLRKGENLILDLGQEMVGRPRITVKAPRRARVEVKVAELLNDSGDKARGNDGPKGSIYMANYRTALARAVYVAAGQGEEIYEPSHSFFGFRYFCISADADVEILAVEGVFISTDMKETGRIETDNPEINRFFENVQWGQRCNYLTVPTDCPQRDERLGWSGDTQIFCGAGTYNANARGFLKKWLGDARDGQRLSAGYWDVIPAIDKLSRSGKSNDGSAAWADAGIVVPYMLYLKYNDLETVAEHFDSMEKYMDYLVQFGGPRPHYGDWLAYEETPEPYICLSYYAYDALLMSKMAKAIGRSDRVVHYTALYHEIKTEFNSRYVENGTLTITTQTACLLALHFGLVEGEVRENVIRLLEKKIVGNDYTLSTGFVGTGILNQTLSEVGLDGLAYSLLLQTRDPSWLYSVRQGATTVWERWNSYTKETGFGKVSMNSFNHYAYGAVVEWMYAAMAGIAADPVCPGFKHFILSPRPDTRKGGELPAGQKPITYVKAHYDSAAGRIESAWDFREGLFTYQFTIPEGTGARVEFPLLNGRDFVMVNGCKREVGDLFGKIENGKAVFELGAGRYILQ